MNNNAEQPIADSDPLESPDYDPIAHVNALFPTPESLNILPRVQSKIQLSNIQIRRWLQQLTTTQLTPERDFKGRIETLERDLKQLMDEMLSLQTKTREVEENVSSMTMEIKRMDTAKKNLRTTMTVVKRLQMLMSAFDQAQRLASAKKYAETASLLSAILQLMSHFKSYRSIPQIALLSQNISDIQKNLMEEVCAEFQSSFEHNTLIQNKALLSQGCELIDVIGDGPRNKIIAWYTSTMLREYRSIFKSSEEAGSLDNISRRYAWLKRVYRTVKEDHSTIFPQKWDIQGHLIRSSCEITREDLVSVLKRQVPEVQQLLNALQETVEFEKYVLDKVAGDDFSRNGGLTIQIPPANANIRDEGVKSQKSNISRDLESMNRGSIDSVRSTQSISSNPAGVVLSAIESQEKGIRIRDAFEPHLGLFVDLQASKLSEMLVSYKSAPWPAMDEQVLPSSADLFYFYLTTLTQCAKLSRGSALFKFSRILAKYLDEYAQVILRSKFQNSVVSVEEIIMILRTADYCAATTSQLEEKIKDFITVDKKEEVTFEAQIETFTGLMNKCLQMLVGHLDKIIQNSLSDMMKSSWSELVEVGDQSPYVPILVAGILREGKRVLQNLGKEKFTRIFCERVVESFTTSYLLAIVKSRPVSEIGAEQMLLDVYAIKAALLNLPGNESPATYAKHVGAQIQKVEIVLKVLLSTASPPEGLVQNYFFLIQDKSTINFAKILELKGLSKTQQTPLINLFIASLTKGDSTKTNAESILQERNPLLTNLVLGDKASDERKFDPSSFFEKQLGLSGLQPLSRQNTGMGSAIGATGEARFGHKFGNLFSKRSASGMDISKLG